MKKKKGLFKLLLSIGLIFGPFAAGAQGIVLTDDKRPGCGDTEDYHHQVGTLTPFMENDEIKHEHTMRMGGSVPLSWPLRMSDEYRETSGVYTYWYISNFADINGTEGSREDWMCNTGSNAKNYDQHNGVDIVPFPFPWQMMDDESVDVIAAADGEVIEWFDGNTVERNCASPHSFVYESFNGGYYGNFIALEHSDGSVTVYAHLKHGKLADLSVGDNVVTGQYLGKIGSSGNSTAPHLHFEVRQCEGCSYFEPWYSADGCNDDITESAWISQVPYDEPNVLRVATHDLTPTYKTCSEYEAGENENVNFSNHFSAVGSMYVSVSLRDYLYGDNFTVDILNSSGTSIANYTSTSFDDYQSVTILFTKSLLGMSTGTYRVKVVHDGKTYDHYFTVNCPSSLTLSGAQSGHKAYITGGNTNSTATISGLSSNVINYQAEEYINLNPGFVATSSCEFKAEINDCTIGGLKTAQEEMLTEQESLLVYPNPSDAIFQVYYTSEKVADAQVIVKNVMGETVFVSQTIPAGSEIALDVNLSNLAKGIYILELHMENEMQTKKIVLQ